jgi:DNA-binding IclR family transcriptional regulator
MLTVQVNERLGAGMSEARGVDAVDRALSILSCFPTGQKALSLAEVAARTGLYKSTILRLAASLQNGGYLVRNAEGRFRLGPAAWRIGAAYRSNFTLSDVMRTELKRVSDETGETASYYVREGESRICLFRSEPTRSIRHTVVEGVHMPVSLGASGKVLTLWSEECPDTDRHLRDTGYAVSLGERDPEVAAVAIPIIVGAFRPLGALSVSGLVTRFTPLRIREFVAVLTASQGRLADQLSE